LASDEAIFPTGVRPHRAFLRGSQISTRVT
jgi:hypothetical protein